MLSLLRLGIGWEWGGRLLDWCWSGVRDAWTLEIHGLKKKDRGLTKQKPP
jgi:hypothetical protein